MSIIRIDGRIGQSMRILILIAGGLLLGKAIATWLGYSPMAAKLRGRAPDCSWSRILSMSRDDSRFEQMYKKIGASLSVLDYDPKLDIELISSPSRAFWIKRSGRNMDGKALLGYLLADHQLLAASGPDNVVRKGDIVLDCGAHVGVFTQKALQLSAARVIAIEPDPVHLECLRRNFAQEIGSGRVVVVPKGVWSSEGKMTLSTGGQNSGSDSMVLPVGGPTIDVPVTTIDNLLRELDFPCVSYIKMDIEGAEREALRGALATLRRCRPRLMLDSYHRPDDMRVLPAIVHEAHRDYLLTCARCEEFYPGLIVPDVIFYP